MNNTTSPRPESIDYAPNSPLSEDGGDLFGNTSLNLEPKNPSLTNVTVEDDGVEPFMRMAQVRGKYCSCSTVYAEHTIVNPNYDQVIFCIAAIIQAQIFEDFGFSEELKAKYPVYDVDIKLPPEFGGVMTTVPDSILNHETMNDLELREKILRGVVPTIDTIFRFINLLYQNAKYSPECNIIALIYVNRLTSSGKMPLTMNNFRGIWLSAIVLAQKVWDDNPLRTSQFNIILPSVTKTVLRDLERRTLNLIEFTTNVKPSLYAKYYFELRTLFTDITGNDSIYQWNLKPLTIIESKQLDMRTKRSVLEIRCARAMGDVSVLTSPVRPVKLSPVDKKKTTNSSSSAANGSESVTTTTKAGDTSSVVTSASSKSKNSARHLRPLNSNTPQRVTNTLEDFTRIDTTRYVLS